MTEETNYRDKRPPFCHQVTRGQDVYCSRCATTWSIDEEKPECLTHGEYAKQQIKAMRDMLNVKD